MEDAGGGRGCTNQNASSGSLKSEVPSGVESVLRQTQQREDVTAAPGTLYSMAILNTLTPGRSLAKRALPYGRAEVSVNLDLASTLIAADVEYFKKKWCFDLVGGLPVGGGRFEWVAERLNFQHGPVESLENPQLLRTALEEPAQYMQKTAQRLEIPHNFTPTEELVGNFTPGREEEVRRSCDTSRTCYDTSCTASGSVRRSSGLENDRTAAVVLTAGNFLKSATRAVTWRTTNTAVNKRKKRAASRDGNLHQTSITGKFA